MSILQTLILGIVQGLTEFLPISSSGHLVLAQNLLGFKEPELLLDTVLHLGTLLAVFAFLYKEIIEILSGVLEILRRPTRLNESYQTHAGVRWIFLVAAGTIPTAIIGVIFKDFFERLFASVVMVGFGLCFTGTLLLIATRILKKTEAQRASFGIFKSFLVGLAQSVAIAPGISRSGTTIAAAVFLGGEVEFAGKLSFLLAVPAILGAALLQIKDLTASSLQNFSQLAVGFAVSALTGYFALRFLFLLLKKKRFAGFGYYCLFVGILTVIIGLNK